MCDPNVTVLIATPSGFLKFYFEQQPTHKFPIPQRCHDEIKYERKHGANNSTDGAKAPAIDESASLCRGHARGTGYLGKGADPKSENIRFIESAVASSIWSSVS